VEHQGFTSLEVEKSVDKASGAYGHYRINSSCELFIKYRSAPDGELIWNFKFEADEVAVSVLTSAYLERQAEQEDYLANLATSLEASGIQFSYEITWEGIHARSIKTDTGWKISLDRGLDIFQAPSDNPFDLSRSSQEHRRCKSFEVTYLRKEDVSFEVG